MVDRDGGGLVGGGHGRGWMAGGIIYSVYMSGRLVVLWLHT